MKNIGASVGAVPTQEKKSVAAVAEEEIEEEECHQMRNEMVFFLKEAPEYRISAVAEWCENSRGDILTAEPDTYFLHVRTGQRCESAWGCLIGWSDDERTEEIWETLCMRIQNTDGLGQIICDEESFGV